MGPVLPPQHSIMFIHREDHPGLRQLDLCVGTPDPHWYFGQGAKPTSKSRGISLQSAHNNDCS